MSKSSSHSEPEQDKKHESKETGSFSKKRKFQSEEIKSLAKFDLSKKRKFQPEKIKSLAKFDLSKMLARNPFLPKFTRKDLISFGTTTESFIQSYETDQFVVKVSDAHGPNSPWDHFEYEALMTFYAQQASERVLKMKKVFYFENYFGLGFEYMPVSLYEWIEDTKKPLPWHNRFSIALEIAKALADLHVHGIIHGRIRSRYVFCDTEKEEIKLTGFRYARMKNVPPPPPVSHAIKHIIRERTDYADYYLTPEVFDNSHLETGSDIYCFGNLLYELATRHIPFAEIKNVNKRRKKINAGETSAIDQNCPLKELIQSCWSLDPAKHPTAAELVKTLTALTFWPKIYVWLWPAPNSLWQRGLPEDILFHIASFLCPKDNGIDVGILVKHTIFIKIKQLLMKRLNSFAEAKSETVPLGAPKEKKLPTRLIGLFHNINNCEALSASVQTQINLLPESPGDEEQQAVRATLQRNHSRLSLLS
jgi:serine/threonine protein kinase